MRSMTGLRRLAVATWLLATIVPAGPVAAMTPIPAATPTGPPSPLASGTVGLYTYGDGRTRPGATCTYGDPDAPPGNNLLDRVAVRPPRVWAAAGRSSQKVGWRVVVEYWDGIAGTWADGAIGRWSSGIATASQAADLRKRTVRVHAVLNADVADGWRVRMQVRWFGRDGTTVTGVATAWLTTYRIREGDLAVISGVPYCSTTTG